MATKNHRTTIALIALVILASTTLAYGIAYVTNGHFLAQQANRRCDTLEPCVEKLTEAVTILTTIEQQRSKGDTP